MCVIEHLRNPTKPRRLSFVSSNLSGTESPLLIPSPDISTGIDFIEGLLRASNKGEKALGQLAFQSRELEKLANSIRVEATSLASKVKESNFDDIEIKKATEILIKRTRDKVKGVHIPFRAFGIRNVRPSEFQNIKLIEAILNKKRKPGHPVRYSKGNRKVLASEIDNLSDKFLRVSDKQILTLSKYSKQLSRGTKFLAVIPISISIKNIIMAKNQGERRKAWKMFAIEIAKAASGLAIGLFAVGLVALLSPVYGAGLVIVGVSAVALAATIALESTIDYVSQPLPQ